MAAASKIVHAGLKLSASGVPWPPNARTVSYPYGYGASLRTNTLPTEFRGARVSYLCLATCQVLTLSCETAVTDRIRDAFSFVPHGVRPQPRL